MNDARDGDGPTIKKRRKCNSSVKSQKLTTDDDSKELEGDDLKTVEPRKKHPAKFRLKTVGECASLSLPSSERVPLVLTDIQHLMLHSILGNLNLSQSPRWYVLEKCGNLSQTTCLILEGISIYHWEKYKDKFIHVNNIFNHFVEVVTPSVYNGSLVQELALVPLSETEKDDIIIKYGSINLAAQARKDLMIMMRAVFPVGEENTENCYSHSNDKFARTQLILSAWQLIEENYPLPLKGKLKDAYSDYVMTKDEYKPVTSKSPMFGLDCEMCLTHAGSELTRISLVNEDHKTIYESLVKPHNDIINYLTRFSGITKELLDNVTKRLEDVQNELKKLLPPDAILVGHSLNTDLHAMKMMHPYVIDTSVIYNFAGARTRKPKLKVLAKEFLQEDIQSGGSGHCSVEDSLATLKLVQLKLNNNLEFGDAVHTNRQRYKENVVKKVIQKPEIALSIFNHVIDNKKTSIVIGCDNITGDYHTYLTQAKESLCSQLRKGKPKKVKLKTVDDADEAVSSLCLGVKEFNLAMAHLKLELENDVESTQIEVIDKWIETIWKSIPQSALCVVIFSGTNSDNGMAMVKTKSS